MPLTQDLQDAVEAAVEVAIQPLEEQIQKNNRLRNIALATAALCLIAASFSVGYAVKSREALNDQAETNRIVVCANARSTALAFREPQISSSGRKETKNHFLNRLVGQRETLIAAGHLSCPNITGFDTFEYLRGEALAEIDRILLRQAPNRAKRIGVDKDGVGLVLPKGSSINETQGIGVTPSGEGSGSGGGGASGHGTNPGSPNHPPAGGGGAKPGPTGPPGEAGAPGPPGPPGEGGNTPPEEEAKPAPPTVLPGVVKPVEEVVCHSVLGKVVCPE